MNLLKIHYAFNHVLCLYSYRASFFSCAQSFRIELSTLPCPYAPGFYLLHISFKASAYQRGQYLPTYH